jgi:hypothetical protein
MIKDGEMCVMICQGKTYYKTEKNLGSSCHRRRKDAEDRGKQTPKFTHRYDQKETHNVLAIIYPTHH